MKIDFNKFLPLALKVFNAFSVVEDAWKIFTSAPKGPAKKTAFIDFLKADLLSAEDVLDKDVVNNDAFIDAASKVADALSALDKVVKDIKAKK